MANAGTYVLGGAIVVLILAVIFGAAASLRQIDSGDIGVMKYQGAVQPDALYPGWYFINPITKSIDTMSIQTKKYVASASAASKDLQDVQAEITVNYHLDPQSVPRIYTNLGTDYENKIIQPAIQEEPKAVMATYEASELVTKRSEVKEKVQSRISARLAKDGIIVEPDGVSLTNFKYSPAFNDAIEQKVTALQLRDKAKNDLERVKFEADQRKVNATVDQVYANNPAMIEVKKLDNQRAAIDRWDGRLPQLLNGGSGAQIPFLVQV